MGISPPNSKKLKNSNKRKRKGKEKESYIFIVYIIFNITHFNNLIYMCLGLINLTLAELVRTFML